MTIFYDDTTAGDKLARGLNAASSFAGGYAQGRRSERDARADEQARKSLMAMREKEQQWEQEDRNRYLAREKADGELAQSLIRGFRPEPVQDVQGPPVAGEEHLPIGAEARAAEIERRRWDEYERLAPSLSPDGRRMLYGQLATESKQRLERVKWDSITRRFAGLTMPSVSSRGSEIHGLNAEDPQQAELLGNIQSMIEAQQDPEGVSELISELEAEILRDAAALERRETTLELMQQAIQSPTVLDASQREAMNMAWQRFQRDPGLDPDEAWNDFLDAQKRPVRDARGGGVQGSSSRWQANPDGSQRFMSPYNSNLELRERAIKDLQQSVIGGGEPSEADVRARMDSYDPNAALEQGMAQGRAASGKAQAGGASSAQQNLGAAASQVMGNSPKPFDSKALPDLESAVDGADTVEEADAAIQKALRARGMREEDVPESVFAGLMDRWKSKRARPALERAREESGYGGAQQVAQGMREGLTGKKAQEKSEPVPDPDLQRSRPQPAEKPKGRSIGDVSREARDGVAKKEAAREAVSTTWKRLPKEKQTELKKALLEAAGKASRFDFHGALAPILRKHGVDLGSIPASVAKEYREALKKARAAQRGR